MSIGAPDFRLDLDWITVADIDNLCYTFNLGAEFWGVELEGSA